MITPRLRFQVLLRCDFTCTYCGRKPPEVKLEIDHIHPRSKGGSDHESNLTAACFECNRGKRDTSIDPSPTPLMKEEHQRIIRRAPGFVPWLRKQTWRDDPVGDLARDVQRTKIPQTTSRYKLRCFFLTKGRHVAHAFYTAWREFNGSAITKKAMRALRVDMLEDWEEGYNREGYRMKVDK